MVCYLKRENVVIVFIVYTLITPLMTTVTYSAWYITLNLKNINDVLVVLFQE